MPVLEHETHEKVIQKEGFRYGCHNRDRTPQSYMVQERDYYGFGYYRMKGKHIHNVLSTECRFDMSLTDPACEACWWQGMGEKYAEEIRKRGT